MSTNTLPATVTTEELRAIGLFGGLTDGDLQHLVDTLVVLTPPPGEILFREGDQGRDMFVVLEGEVEVLKRSKTGSDARVAMLGPGDWFGEMSILDVQPRSATVVGLAPSRLLKIRTQDLEALYRQDMKAYSLVILNLARELSRRLRVADGMIADFVANFIDSYLPGPRHG
jgi:CRP/FNR family cyclic AMP-dependent transcriptional regulator